MTGTDDFTPLPPRLPIFLLAKTNFEVSAIKTHTFSSKSELFWRGRRPFKVLQKLDAALQKLDAVLQILDAKLGHSARASSN